MKKQRRLYTVLCVLTAALLLLAACAVNSQNTDKKPEKETAAVTEATAKAPETEPFTEAPETGAPETEVPETEPVETEPPIPTTKHNTVKWPEPKAGERLFIGEAPYEEAEKFLVGFVLTKDGNSIRGLTIAIDGLKFERTVSGETVTVSEEGYASACPADSEEDISSGTLKSFGTTLRFLDMGEELTAELDYVHEVRRPSDFIEVPLGKQTVTFVCYIDKRTAAPVSDYSNLSTDGWFIALNNVPPEQFTELYNRAMDEFRAKDCMEGWNQICAYAAGYHNFLHNEKLYPSMVWENYRLDPDGRSDLDGSSREDVRWEVEKGLSGQLLEKALAAGAPDFELPEAVWTAGMFSRYYGEDDCAAFRPAYPEPLYVLVVDISGIIGVSGRGIISTDSADGRAVANRAGKLTEPLRQNAFRYSSEVIRFTCDPDRASILLTVDVSYPYRGTYSSNLSNADVYACHAELNAYSLADGSRLSSFSIDNEPAESISASQGSTTVWKDIPALEENADFISFVEEIFSR